MRWGQPWSTPWGDPEEWTIILSVDDFGSGAAVTFHAVFSQYYQLVIDGKASGNPLYVAAGTEATLRGSYTGQAPHTLSVIGQGGWSIPNLYDVSNVQTEYVAGRTDRIVLDLIGEPEQFSENDGGQLTDWAVNGVKRFTNCRTVPYRSTWGEVDILLTTTGTTHLLQLLRGGILLASGSRFGNGVITLSEANGSGIAANGTNTVTLTYANDLITANGAVLETAFPVEYRVYYRIGTPWTVFGNPTATVTDDGRKSTASFSSGPLATGTYYVVVHQVNEDGIESTGTTNLIVPIVHVPGAPGVPIYVSGGAGSSGMLWDVADPLTPGQEVFWDAADPISPNQAMVDA